MLHPTPCPSCRYLDYIKDCVYQSPSQAQLGGVPGTFQLVRSFLHLRQLAATPGLEVCLTTAAQSSPVPPPSPPLRMAVLRASQCGLLSSTACAVGTWTMLLTHCHVHSELACVAETIMLTVECM